MRGRQPRIRRRKGQSIIEFAFGSIILLLFLAAATDFGRAYFTYIVVQQMAGEGAQYLSTAPDADKYLNPGLPATMTFQERARNVAVRALASIVDPANVSLPTAGNPGDVTTNVTRPNRCAGTQFTVSVSYHINDLFFPGLLGVRSLTLSATAASTFQEATMVTPNNCPSP